MWTQGGAWATAEQKQADRKEPAHAYIALPCMIRGDTRGPWQGSARTSILPAPARFVFALAAFDWAPFRAESRAKYTQYCAERQGESSQSKKCTPEICARCKSALEPLHHMLELRLAVAITAAHSNRVVMRIDSHTRSVKTRYQGLGCTQGEKKKGLKGVSWAAAIGINSL